MNKYSLLQKEIFYKNPLNISDKEIGNFPVRNAARAVAITPENKVVVIKGENDIHGLPGGGMEEGEDIIQTLIRECKEETGYDISVVSALGYAKIIRKNYVSINFGFIVRTQGVPSEIKLTDEEKFLGHVVEECTLEEAQSIIRKDLEVNNSFDERSLKFLEEAKKYLDNN